MMEFCERAGVNKVMKSRLCLFSIVSRTKLIFTPATFGVLPSCGDQWFNFKKKKNVPKTAVASAELQKHEHLCEK